MLCFLLSLLLFGPKETEETVPSPSPLYFFEKLPFFAVKLFYYFFAAYMKVFFANLSNLDESRQKCNSLSPPPIYFDSSV